MDAVAFQHHPYRHGEIGGDDDYPVPDGIAFMVGHARKHLDTGEVSGGFVEFKPIRRTGRKVTGLKRDNGEIYSLGLLR